MFTRKFDRRIYVAVGVIGFSLVLGGAFGTYALWQSNLETGYQPAQPMEFNHALMAGQFKIECIYCHSQAEKGRYATIPPTSTCMKCHTEIQVKNTKGELKPVMAELYDYWERKVPIHWAKVHDLADFVYFDHSRHIAGGVECEECHGKVETMERVQRVYSLKMGWCLDCHKEDPTDLTSAGLETRAPLTCSTCHR
jgi:hypothetical protein